MAARTSLRTSTVQPLQAVDYDHPLPDRVPSPLAMARLTSAGALLAAEARLGFDHTPAGTGQLSSPASWVSRGRGQTCFQSTNASSSAAVAPPTGHESSPANLAPSGRIQTLAHHNPESSPATMVCGAVHAMLVYHQCSMLCVVGIRWLSSHPEEVTLAYTWGSYPFFSSHPEETTLSHAWLLSPASPKQVGPTGRDPSPAGSAVPGRVQTRAHSSPASSPTTKVSGAVRALFVCRQSSMLWQTRRLCRVLWGVGNSSHPEELTSAHARPEAVFAYCVLPQPCFTKQAVTTARALSPACSATPGHMQTHERHNPMSSPTTEVCGAVHALSVYHQSNVLGVVRVVGCLFFSPGRSHDSVLVGNSSLGTLLLTQKNPRQYLSLASPKQVVPTGRDSSPASSAAPGQLQTRTQSKPASSPTTTVCDSVCTSFVCLQKPCRRSLIFFGMHGTCHVVGVVGCSSHPEEIT